ncbi:MAG TPA: glycoside hydrolase 100 family protein [Burkholderiales bacterium]|nr:glycoside hydrolase 100 family protein [Burkholderiales bacterium]
MLLEAPGVASQDGATTLQRCHEAAIALLKANLGEHGMLAATPTDRAQRKNYHLVFARDAGLCALAMVRTGDPDLVDGARRSLRTLALDQAENGQIPKFVSPADQDADFWYVGCIDATLWWLIALRHYLAVTHDADLEVEFAGRVDRALDWLRCQEHPRLKLLTQNEASDWADVMPRSGFVLYTNALWYYVKKLYALPGQRETRHQFNHLFFPFSGERPEYKRLRLLNHYARREAKNRDLYLSFVNFSFWGDEGDVMGNVLAVLLGLADEHRGRSILRALDAARVDEPYPVRVVLDPIEPGSPLWRTYMQRHQQNLAHQYHNGGCWPFVGGFWIMALAAAGQRARAREALLALARANEQNGWEFNEWFHGRTGEAMGMQGQSWNAATYLLAETSLHTRVL